MNFQLASGIAELCASHGIAYAVICPGSRSAPLVLAFTQNKKIKCLTFSDERSAAFIALGIAQQTGKTVVLVCTSGSAAYNFAPAVAEAFFQHVPLLILTADRPKEWVDQWDGQTIYQNELFGKHVKRFFELPTDQSHNDGVWYVNRLVNEAILSTSDKVQGPVHMNIPFREPLYETHYAPSPQWSRVIHSANGVATLNDEVFENLVKRLAKFKRILIAPGQQQADPSLSQSLTSCRENFLWPMAGDILSNLHSMPSFCGHADTFLGALNESQKKQLQPDLLITFGHSLVAKNLKLFLRQFKPQEHWHIQPYGMPADTFQGLTQIIQVSPSEFFGKLANIHRPIKNDKSFDDLWSGFEATARESIESFFKKNHSGEFHLAYKLIHALPSNSQLHLANSMSVRYANHIGLLDSQKGVEVFSNRGTSGIDGCSSTAVGHSLASEIPQFLVTGDQAFFYDRNAFWHNYDLPGFHVIILNNHGGVIFNLIDGPSGVPQSEEFFITRQQLNARSLAGEFGLEYFSGTGTDLDKFMKDGSKARLMEIESTQAESKAVFENFRATIKKVYEAKA